MQFRWGNVKQRGADRPRAIQRMIAIVAVFAMSLGLASVTASAAQAATPGIEIAILHNGSVVGDDEVIPEGDDLTLRVQYDADADIAGKEITLTLPGGITAPSSFPTNEAIESIVTNEDGTITVKFKDEIPSDVTEGAFALTLKVKQVEGNTETPISWKIGDDTGGVTFIVENKVIPPVEVTDGYSKGVNPGNLNGFVQTSGTPDYTFTGLDPSIANEELVYTLVLSSAEARDSYAISDALAAHLGYVAGSFAATLTTSEGTDAFAFNPTVTGNTFSGTVDVPAQSTLTITYNVKVTNIPALEALVQEQFDARDDAPGNYGIALRNTASFGTDADRTANVGLTGNIPGPGVGNNFAKSGNWNLRDVVADDDGNLVPAADMTYTLSADLSPWDERNPNFTLQKNVVITDTLIEQASWKTGTGFIAISGTGPITELTEATGFSGDAAAFAANTYVGKFAVVGQTLFVNVGTNDKDDPTNVQIQVNAQLNSVDGLTGTPDPNVAGGTRYPWNNKAQFTYGPGQSTDREFKARVVVLPEDYEGGVNDSSAFNKTAGADEIRVTPGESATVPYRFTIDTSKPNIDPLKSKITDAINTDIFDISDLSTIPVTGSYGSQTLTSEHFALSINETDDLVIELSEAGRSLVGSLAAGQQWIIDIVLTTIPLDGKQTFEIYNRATLETADSEWDYWSEDQSEATSYGDEAELRKRIFDPTSSEWTSDINAQIEDGAFVNDTFIYSIELIPRGNYGEAFPVTIFTRDDVLPESVEFLGFVNVDDTGAPLLDPLSTGPVDLQGNVVASYAESDGRGVVSIAQKQSTNLDPNQGRIVTYFAVKGFDASQEIINTIAGSETTITPVGDPSIDIEKWNDEGEAPAYDESGALLNDGYAGDFDESLGKPLQADTPLPINFTISNDGREDLVDVVVSDELTDGAGVIEDLECVFPDESTGTEWAGPFKIGTQFNCTGTLPALASGDTHSDLAQVSGVGILTGTEVDDEDPWNAYVPTPSIDIEKWNDEGETPAYDESGALLNDGFDGDFDEVPGKTLTAGSELPIRFTVSNDGAEPLIDIAVSDELTSGKGQISDLLCVFPDESEGTEWAGPLAIGAQFNCTGTLPALLAGDAHADVAKVTAVGLYSGIGVDDEDDWYGNVPAAVVPGDGLSNTGGNSPLWLGGGALALLLAGGVTLLVRRKLQL